MTAEPTGHVMWTPDPIKQRARAYTVEDVFALPDDAPRVELLDGVLSVVPSPSGGHQKINYRVVAWLERNAPGDLEALMAVGVITGYRDTLEPDVTLLRKPVDFDHHYYPAAQVLLAVEIVSPSTKRRDRMEKPLMYATAGIPHFWRIEQNPIHVFAYDLIDGEYKLVADSDSELVLTAPFEIKLPIRDITP
jgi:Uma2 family endonuclease